MTRAVAWISLGFSLYAVAATSAVPMRAGQPVVQVPLHGSYVSDPVMSKADGDALKAEIAAIRKELGEIRDAIGSAQPKAQAPAKPDLVPVAARHCARCHSPGAAPDRGDGLVLFADDAGSAFVRPMPAYLQTRVRQTVADGSMPKTGTKPTPQEKALFQSFEVK